MQYGCFTNINNRYSTVMNKQQSNRTRQLQVDQLAGSTSLAVRSSAEALLASWYAAYLLQLGSCQRCHPQ
jgi:hypothetical protein